MTDDDWIHDIAFDPDDVDATDYVELTRMIHGAITPRITEVSQEMFVAVYDGC